MNLSLSDRSVHTASKGCPEEEKAEVRHSCFRRTTYGNPSGATYPSGSLISQLLRKTIQSKRALDENPFYLPAVGVLSSSAQEDQNSSSSKCSLPEPTSPGAHTSSSPSAVAGPEGEWPLNEHHRAKRARVENIIRGMAGSPQGRLPEEEERSQEEARDCRENKRKQRLPQHQDLLASRGSSSSKDEECHRLREQLQAMQRLLRQLQEKFFQVHGASEQVNREETAPSGPAERNGVAGNAEGSERELLVDYDDELESGPGGNEAGQRETRKMDSDQVTFLTEGKNLPEALKQELSRAVSESVDLVFKRFSSALLKQPGRLQMSQTPEALRVKTRTPNGEESPQGEDYEGAEPPEPEDQTEALSLVVRKQPLSHPSSVIQAVNRPYTLHQAPFQFGYGTSLHENQILEHLLKYAPHSNFAGLPRVPPALERSSPDSMDLPWDAVMARSKVSSTTHMGHHARPTALGQVMVDGLGLPGVKMECGELQGMVDRNPYLSLNEGLTPNHLKKAKLMFFYSRYPSSNVLKTFFPDVKFNRCVTSQLIKWFSNFREFYYIQMEKFARQAVMDGVDNAKDLSVTRGSELFRALNMHYNKTNDFQVPERFLEVAEITLQEFFNAISLAKDSDPSWKKAIYKIICKLDSEVPEEFKISACL